MKALLKVVRQYRLMPPVSPGQGDCTPRHRTVLAADRLPDRNALCLVLPTLMACSESDKAPARRVATPTSAFTPKKNTAMKVPVPGPSPASTVPLVHRAPPSLRRGPDLFWSRLRPVRRRNGPSWCLAIHQYGLSLW